MASVVELCSNSLRSLGEDAITSLTDDTDRARLCNAFYPSIRDAVLRAHPWNCATERQTLSKLAAAPDWGFSNQFTLPTDPFCLRVLQLSDIKQVFKIEGRKLLTDDSTAKILYIKRIEDPNEFDVSLYNAIQWRMSAQLAIPITGQRAVAADMFALYEQVISETKKVDGMESPRDPIVVSTLLDVR